MKNITQKLFALFVLALFLVSVVPLALADDVDQDQDDVHEDFEEEEEEEEEVEDDERDDKQHAQDMIDKAEEEIAKAADQIAQREANGKDVSKALEILEDAKSHYEQALEAFEEEEFIAAERLAKEARNLANDARKGRNAQNPFRRLFRIGDKEHAQDRVEQVKERNQEHREEIREHVKEVQERAQEHREEVLKRAHMQREKMHDSLEKAREHYQDKKEELRDHKQDLQDKRKELSECQKNADQECDEERHKIKRGVLNQGRNNIDFIVAAFEKIKHRIDEADDIPENDKESILAMIDAKLAQLESAKEEFDALGDDATAEEIRAAAQNLKDVWHDMKPTYKWAVEMVLASKLANTVDHIETSEDRLEAKIAELEAEGHDMSEAYEVLAELNDVLSGADLSIDEAQALLASLGEDATAGEIREVTQEAHSMLQDVRGTFGEARELLREIFGFLKAAQVEE